jgi:hypothetical protein
MLNEFYTKLVVFFTAFGSVFSIKLFNEYGGYYFLLFGSLILIAGFTYLTKFAKKAA